MCRMTARWHALPPSRPRQVTVGHDNSGHGPSWHLDHLAVTNLKTGQTFLFPCRMWFDSRIGDGMLERTLAAAE